MSTVKPSRGIWPRLLLCLFAASVSLAATAQNETLSLPDMGASAETILSRAEEAEYAKALLMQMRAYEVLNEDPLINAFFRDMGYRLASNSDRPDKTFTFVVLDQPVVNAFAAPGGVIALFSDLILTADDESEIAGVLAHEIAHITQLHLYRAIEHQQAMTIPIALAMLGLVLAGGGSGEAIQGALIGGQAAALQSQIYFTRQHEYEADRIGMSTLSRAGYDPDGMAEFFEKMGRLARAMGEGPPEFLRTHPVSTSRISEARNRAENLPHPEKSNNRNFYIVQARLRAKSHKPDVAIEWFDHRARQAEISQAESDAVEYGKAIALQRKGEFEKARAMLQNLMDRDYHLAWELQMAELDLEAGRSGQAQDRLSGLYHSFAGNQAISLQYAQALLKDSEPEKAAEAARVIRKQLASYPDDPTLYELYARSWNIAGNSIRAREAIAESYYLRGGIHEAAMQLQHLTETEDLDYYQRARINARINELRLELAKLGIEDA